MNDTELIAEARRAGAELRRRDGDLDRLAGVLLAEMADRLAPPAPVPAGAMHSLCKGCGQGAASVRCPRCGVDGQACANCGRCPPCDGPVPDEEEEDG